MMIIDPVGLFVLTTCAAHVMPRSPCCGFEFDTWQCVHGALFHDCMHGVVPMQASHSNDVCNLDASVVCPFCACRVAWRLILVC